MKTEQHQKVNTLFNSWAGTERGERMAFGHDPLLQPLKTDWNWEQVEAVLDLGCGNGRALSLVQAWGGKRLAGLDVSDKMIVEAKKNVPTADLRVGNIEALPWADDSFSHVLSVEALYYLEDPTEGLAEIRRVLKTEGCLAIMIEFFAENEASHVWAKNLPTAMVIWSEAEWVTALKKAGFSNAKASRIRRTTVKTEAEFQPSPSFPSYAQYLAYVEAGALYLQA